MKVPSKLFDYLIIIMMVRCPQVSGSEGEGEDIMEVPLSRNTKAVSLAAGLNTLQVEEEEPDGEGSSAGQTSFLHSKCRAII